VENYYYIYTISHHSFTYLYCIHRISYINHHHYRHHHEYKSIFYSYTRISISSGIDMLPVMTSTGFTKVYQTNNNNNNSSSTTENSSSPLQQKQQQGLRLPIFMLPSIELNRVKAQQELEKLDLKRQSGGSIAVNFIAYIDIKRY
jgi:hypothetical protein